MRHLLLVVLFFAVFTAVQSFKQLRCDLKNCKDRSSVDLSNNIVEFNVSAIKKKHFQRSANFMKLSF